MANEKIWTAAELEQMSPNERADLVRGGFQTDLEGVSPDLLARARQKIDAHIAAAEGTTPAPR